MPDYDDPRVPSELQQVATGGNYGGLKHIPLRAQLTEELKHHQKEIKRITQLLELMEANPAIEQFVNLQRGYTL